MSQDIADMPGIEAAMEHFETIEKSSTPSAVAASETPARREALQADAQPAARPSETQNSDSQSSDTPATADQKPVATETIADQKVDAAKPAEPKTDAPKSEPDKSRYAKSQERLTKTWEQVNSEKATLTADRTKFDAERLEFNRQKAEFDTIRQQAQQPQYKPEDYDRASQGKRRDADALRMQARRAEDAGKFDDAAKLNKQADKTEGTADDLRDHAENLRRNPPKGFAEKTAQYEHAKKAWTVEAAKAFPDLAKENSDFQKTVSGHLQALSKNDPQLLANPSVIYHVSRLTAAEMKAKALSAEAARVPVLMKETESLRAKIKELEALTTPAGGGGVGRLGGNATADDYNSLRQAAAENVALFR